MRKHADYRTKTIGTGEPYDPWWADDELPPATLAAAAMLTPSLDALLRAAASDGQHPARNVEAWDPPYCGDIGLKICRDGTWLYRGSPIGRVGMIKLFASILRKDADGRTYLVTPAEKVDVEVEDAPFLAVELASDGTGTSQRLTLRTNVDDVVAIDAEHPIRFEPQPPDGGLKPYVLMRGKLEALCTRAVYAELVAMAVIGNDDQALGFWSGGCWWRIAAPPAE